MTTAQGTAQATLEPASGIATRSALLLDCLPIPVVRLDLAQRVLEVNDAWRRLLRDSGTSAEDDGVGRTYRELVAPLGAPAVLAAEQLLASSAEGPGAASSALLPCYQNRTLRWYRVDACRSSDAVLLLHTDITQQRWAELQLRVQTIASAALAERRPLLAACRDVVAAACEGLAWEFAAVWLPNHWQRLVCAALIADDSLAHTEFESITRTARFERGQGLVGRVWESCRALWLPDLGVDKSSARLQCARALGLRSGFAVPMAHDGQVFAVVELMGRHERAEDAQLTEILSRVGQLLGAEEQRARALVRAEADGTPRTRLEQLIENAPGFIVAIDLQRRIHFINRVQPHVRRDEVVGSDWLRFVPPDQHPFLLPKLAAVLEQGVPQHYDLGIIGPDGREVWLSVHMAPLREQGVITGAVITSLDTTELKRAQMEFAAAQRWISVGTLAAGIAHEINTPVQFVSDNLQFIGDAARRLSTLAEKLAALPARIAATTTEPALLEAASQAERALLSARLPYLQQELPPAIGACIDGLSRVSTIVRSLKDFAQPAAAELELCDINGLVRRALAIAAAEYAAVAELLSEWGELPPVPCRGVDISQVVLNVILNAVDAIRDVVSGTGQKGRLVVRTWCENGHAVITIEDSGAGIPEAIRARVFDPFFTTKGVGKGTGQGLALAWSIITQQHGGVIAFESTIGKGTTFFIRLPLAGRGQPSKAPRG